MERGIFCPLHEEGTKQNRVITNIKQTPNNFSFILRPYKSCKHHSFSWMILRPHIFQAVIIYKHYPLENLYILYLDFQVYFFHFHQVKPQVLVARKFPHYQNYQCKKISCQGICNILLIFHSHRLLLDRGYSMPMVLPEHPSFSIS